MCLACQMEGEWLAYLEHLAQREAAQQELRQEPASVADVAAPAKSLAKSVPSRFVCEEPPTE